MAEDTREIWVADSETDPFELGVIPAPFIWGVYHGYEGGKYWEFTDTGDFVNFIKSKDIIIYAHNGGKFDWHFLSPWFDPQGDLLIINGRLSKFTIGNCEFRDSFNLMPVALDQYQKEEFDYNKMHKLVRHKYMNEIKAYLKSDCVNLWNMVYGFDNNYGRHITQASAAMHFWKYRLRNSVPRSDDAFYDTFKPFYYGGRVQCFEFGDIAAELESVDINSAYPHAMLSKHAYSLEYTLHNGKPTAAMSEWGSMFFTVAAVARGCFPYRGTNGNLYYPADDVERNYFVTGWELLTAIETKTIESIKYLEYYKFAETRDFSEYVNYFWNLRQEFKRDGDKGGEFYCKIFLNSLYGKFGMDIRKHKNYTLHPANEKNKLLLELKDGETIQDFREWCIHAEQAPMGRKRFYNLATAASVTGYVRAKLWRAICGATRPVYCDTDSITAAGFGKDVLLNSDLGNWGLEYEYDRAIVCGKKLYSFHIKGKPLHHDSGWKIASKGARLSYKEIQRLAKGQTVRYNNIVPTFSATKKEPKFISRDIQATAQDISTVPRRLDPKFIDD